MGDPSLKENDKIDILQLNENNTILAQNKASFCFQALVFSFPKAQCHWITPNQTQIECRETHYPNCNRYLPHAIHFNANDGVCCCVCLVC